jgi:hypothetical protein
VKPPKEIDVGPFTYRVRSDADAVARIDAEESGLYDDETLTITINPNRPAQVRREVLLHEFLHAVTDITGLAHELGQKREEKIVRRMAPVLLAALRANPELVDYLTDGA